MKNAMTPRLAALALAAGLGIAACGSSDADTGATTADDSAVDSGADVADATPAVLEVSASLTTDGDALAPVENEDDDPAVGSAAPVITGQQFDGTDITIGGATDGPTMLVFLAHWCPACNAEIPELVELRDDDRLPEDLNIIGISTAVVDDRDNYPPSDWLARMDWSWPALADTLGADAFQTFGGTGFPYTVMLDGDGTVLARKSGNESADQILSWIDEALSGAATA